MGLILLPYLTIVLFGCTTIFVNFKQNLGMLFKGQFFFFLFASFLVFAQEPEETLDINLVLENTAEQELSLKEWKKFKDFERKLALDSLEDSQQQRQLMGYAKDSIQILGVKLMAVKLLDEKKLLEKDILENEAYYQELLKELRASELPQSSYLFLEEKLAFLRLASVEKELSVSKWFNFLLVVLFLAALYGIWRLRATRRNIPLSNQELNVKELILAGKSNKEIANELFISLSTVKTHITNIYGKLNISTRHELVQKYTGTST